MVDEPLESEEGEVPVYWPIMWAIVIGIITIWPFGLGSGPWPADTVEKTGRVANVAVVHTWVNVVPVSPAIYKYGFILAGVVGCGACIVLHYVSGRRPRTDTVIRRVLGCICCLVGSLIPVVAVSGFIEKRSVQAFFMMLGRVGGGSVSGDTSWHYGMSELIAWLVLAVVLLGTSYFCYFYGIDGGSTDRSPTEKGT